jgi:signal transduction histidine kinase
MKQIQEGTGAFWALRWNWLLLGVVAYIALGTLVKGLANPMVPDAILALNMVVLVVVGYFAGPATGALTGLIATTLNFSLQLPLAGSDAFEAAAILPHTIMGGAAGWMARATASRLATTLTLLLGHLLNIGMFLSMSLLPLEYVWNAVFWTGIIAEATLGLIFVMLSIALIQQLQKQDISTAVSRLGWRRFMLVSGLVALLVVVLAIVYLSGVTLAGYLFIIPVVLAVFFLGALEALLTAFVLSIALGSTIVPARASEAGLISGTSDTAVALSLILTLNLIALALGELAGHAQKQRRLAQRRLVELEDAYIALSEADRLKSEMIQNISHELRTPLAIILGYSELLAEGALGEMPEQQREIVHTTWEYGRRLAYLVEQITVLHQAEQGALSWQALALDSLVRSHVDLASQVAAESGCRLSVTTLGEIPVLEGDLQCLGRAVKALLENAIKFSPNGGHVELKLWAENERVSLTIRDEGVGIPLEKHEEIFRRFYQVDGSATRRFAGMGTGLALVKEVVQAHGGDVSVESCPGQGSIFGFWLPLQRPPTVNKRHLVPADFNLGEHQLSSAR